ncbi:MAG: sulfurtransferase TusA family protein [bacterium]|nr:sulfurtransferase TusA family protein [bacterium]
MSLLPEEIRRAEPFRRALAEFLAGGMDGGRFTGIRVPWGFYSHRGHRLYMGRVRVAAGRLSPRQARAIALAAAAHGAGTHLTTRQDIQIHGLRIEETAAVVARLAEDDLSTRGGGGNTVRNVTACPLAGICPEEAFDVGGYAVALTGLLLRREGSFDLPRKFKVALSGCARDCAACGVNDVGLIAALRGGERGFTVLAGGGMGRESRVGGVLEDFIPAEEAGACVEAVKNVFARHGDRKNRRRNRLRFLIEAIGFDRFARLCREERAALRPDGSLRLRPEPPRGDAPPAGAGGIPAPARSDVRPQRQPGFSVAELRVPRGDIPADALLRLADLEADYPGIEFRTTQGQNLAVAWVRNESVPELLGRAGAILGDPAHAGTLLDIVACKGSLTCNLGLCNAPGLAAVLEEGVRREFMRSPLFPRVRIRVNGCPNNCAGAPVGMLSFSGLVRRAEGRPVPFYSCLVGGRPAGAATRLAREAGVLPAKAVPEFLRRFLRRIEEAAAGGDAAEVIEAGGEAIARGIIADLGAVPPHAANPDFYRDWGSDEEFSLRGIGPGECGAGIIDMIESDLREAGKALEEAERGDFRADGIRRALFLSSRALLVVRGKDPRDEEAAFAAFAGEFIETGIASRDFARTAEVFRRTTDDLPRGGRRAAYIHARDLLAHVRGIYGGMDSSFRFPGRGGAAPGAAGGPLDVRGVPCPLNFAKILLALEKVPPGGVLEIILDGGAGSAATRRSIEAEGCAILAEEERDGRLLLRVRRGERRE